MQNKLPLLFLLFLAALIYSCGDAFREKCETAGEFNSSPYQLVTQKCLGVAGPPYTKTTLYVNGKIEGPISQQDDCIFIWHVNEEKVMAFDTCNNTANEIKADKTPLAHLGIDSVTIYSSEHKQTKRLDRRSIGIFVDAWNQSTPIRYQQAAPEYAFYPFYEYKMTFFSPAGQRVFYCSGYMAVDSSKWVYKMNKKELANYFHMYWQIKELI